MKKIKLLFASGFLLCTLVLPACSDDDNYTIDGEIPLPQYIPQKEKPQDNLTETHLPSSIGLNGNENENEFAEQEVY